MKHLIISTLLLFSFSLTSQSFFSPTQKQLNFNSNFKAPCFNLFSSGSTANSDDIVSIKLTNDATGTSETYWLGPSWSYGLVTSGAGAWCGTFDIAVTVTVGGNAALGIRNKNTGAIWSCQNVCCGEGQIITFNNVPLSTPYGTSWEIFYYVGSC